MVPAAATVCGGACDDAVTVPPRTAQLAVTLCSVRVGRWMSPPCWCRARGFELSAAGTSVKVKRPEVSVRSERRKLRRAQVHRQIHGDLARSLRTKPVTPARRSGR